MSDLPVAAAALGCYVLPGGVSDPNPAITQARAAEALGLGTVFVGERYSTKDLPSLAGALSQVTRRVRVAAGVTHVGTRHPMVLASMGQTLQALTGGRFVLGFGRGTAARWHAYGIDPPTEQTLVDTANLLRRLWAGERVTYTGALGTFPDLALIERAPVPPPPLLLAAIGPRTLDVGGATFDGVILHPFLTTDAVHRAAERARSAAEAQGRDPAALEIHATVIVAPDHAADEVVGARALGYLLMGEVGEALIRSNQWDPAGLDAVRADPRVAGRPYSDLKSVSTTELTAIGHGLPGEWLTGGAAIGTPTECALRLAEYLDAGATGILLHGTTPDRMDGLVEAFVACRSAP
jgi:5,10-methylenetetrahydromethanopterin reductase